MVRRQYVIVRTCLLGLYWEYTKHLLNSAECKSSIKAGYMEKQEMEMKRKLEMETGNGNWKRKLEMEEGFHCIHSDKI